jgi:glycosyltransferase involved in cell wall biosynthesis
MDPDTFVIVTAYNEAELIEATLAALASAFPGAPVFVGDDGSSDATARLASAAGARVVRSERVIGKGGAATLAARAALAAARPRAAVQANPAGTDPAPADRQAPVFLLCDGDLGASAAELRTLVTAVAAGEADVSVAAFKRRVGGGVGLALGFARWAIRRRCGLETGAPISGQRALSERALRAVLPFAHGFGMEIGMTVDAVRAGYRVQEIELDLTHRASGRTFAGFAHRAGQLLDFARVYGSRGRLGERLGARARARKLAALAASQGAAQS